MIFGNHLISWFRWHINSNDETAIRKLMEGHWRITCTQGGFWWALKFFFFHSNYTLDIFILQSTMHTRVQWYFLSNYYILFTFIVNIYNWRGKNKKLLREKRTKGSETIPQVQLCTMKKEATQQSLRLTCLLIIH